MKYAREPGSSASVVRSIGLGVHSVAALVLLARAAWAEPATPSPRGEPHFSFVVTADPRADHDSWMNALCEMRDSKGDEVPRFEPPSWIVVAGDFDPARQRMEDVQDAFAGQPLHPDLLPVIGNHDLKPDNMAFVREEMLARPPGLVRRQPDACDYYYDFRNVRLIALDLYGACGQNGTINKEGRHWVETVLDSTPPTIDHIFLSFHDPAFPRGKHLKDSMNRDLRQRDAFWQLLVAHNDRVRAVFVGHTHCYSRMRVRGPEDALVKDVSAFPDELGGIYQIDAGATGHAASNTFVRVQIDGKLATARAYAAPNGSNQAFAVIDRWQF